MEYANIDLFRLNKDQNIDGNKVDGEMDNHRTNGRLTSIIVDNNYNIIDNAEAYIAGKNLGLKYLESSRIKSIKDLNSDFPAALLVEITNRCNLLCRMCPRNQLTREEKDMDVAVFKRLMDEISMHQIDGLWLYNIGESMLHSRFFEMLSYVNKYPNIHPLWLSTNGTTLNETNANKLLNSKLDFLNFSLNALDEETYKIISPRSKFHIVMKNLNNFLMKKKRMNKRKPFLRVQVIDQPEVHNQIKTFIEEWGPKADIISINQLERFIGQREIPSNKDIIEKPLKNTEPCKRIDRGFLYVFSNNKVGICATDFNCVNSVGDVSTMSIKEIWTGKECKRLYENIKNRRYDKVPLCYVCTDKGLA
jgi:wyosine [tRNA(Phe)-imidazoG37] synthetase (radical SAM superfamily)